VTRRTLEDVSEVLLRIPEVARRLDIEGPEVYGLIERGELEAGKGRDGLVYVSENALRDFEAARAGSSP
jgi:hypothetical protein